jgi:hypothetical protein
VGESSKPRVTSHILLNKWQCQQEKERYQKHKYEEEKRRYEEEMSVRIGHVSSLDTVGTRV